MNHLFKNSISTDFGVDPKHSYHETAEVFSSKQTADYNPARAFSSARNRAEAAPFFQM